MKLLHFGQKVEKFETQFWPIFSHKTAILGNLVTAAIHGGLPGPSLPTGATANSEGQVYQ